MYYRAKPITGIFVRKILFKYTNHQKNFDGMKTAKALLVDYLSLSKKETLFINSSRQGSRTRIHARIYLM